MVGQLITLKLGIWILEFGIILAIPAIEFTKLLGNFGEKS
jgi:hypothetical protein